MWLPPPGAVPLPAALAADAPRVTDDPASPTTWRTDDPAIPMLSSYGTNVLRGPISSGAQCTQEPNVVKSFVRARRLASPAWTSTTPGLCSRNAKPKCWPPRRLWTTDIQVDVVDRCLQIFSGTNGVMKELIGRSL